MLENKNKIGIEIINHIRKFRNRIFHHENILKDEFVNIEDDIYEILGYFDIELVEFTKKANTNSMKKLQLL